MTVGRICQRDVDLAGADESVWQAAERMHQRTVGTLVVLDEAKKPIGMVTDRDLAIQVIAERRDPYTTSVGEVMTKTLKTVSENDSIEAALSLMRSGAFRRLPVVDANGTLVGIVTFDDILMLLAEEFGQIGQLLERQTPRAAAET
jgi:CBS domain-containing protein